jgi:hypothetical protein
MADRPALPDHAPESKWEVTSEMIEVALEEYAGGYLAMVDGTMTRRREVVRAMLAAAFAARNLSQT